jgi:membrane protein required for colicin V production
MTIADLAIIGIMVLSGVLALMRGFTREVFSILSWAGASFITLWLFPPLLPTGRSLLGFLPTIARDVTTGVVIFMVSLVALSYVTTKLTEKVRGKEPGNWDGTAGFIFGLARGFMVVAVLFLFYGWVVQPKKDPTWIANAKLLPLIKKTDKAFIDIVAAAQEKIPVNTQTASTRGSAGGGAHRVWFPSKSKKKKAD